MDIGRVSDKDKGMAVGGTILYCMAFDWDNKFGLCQKPRQMI
jgi:hypothetical protein